MSETALGTAGRGYGAVSRYAGRWVIAAMAALLTACGADPSADHVAIADDVRADVLATVQASNASDDERAIRSNAPDFIQMFHGQANADNLANTKAQLADPAVKLTINDGKVDISEAGDMVFYSNRYVYDFTDPESERFQAISQTSSQGMLQKGGARDRNDHS